MGKEENQIVKDLVAGHVTKSKNAEKQRWADMEESETTEQSEMEEESMGREEAGRKKRKTNWAALLEVAREKDMTTAEKNGPEKEWRAREGKGKTRSGVSEKKGKGPSPGLRMVPNMVQVMLRVPEETGNETETEGEEKGRRRSGTGERGDEYGR